MIKAIIFDFDGVIVESSEIKTNAFRTIFSQFPDVIPEILEYHIQNMGVSRYTKFRHIYTEILRQPYSDILGNKLGLAFSEIVFGEIVSAPLVSGIRDFLENNLSRYSFFIASGTPEVELLEIAARKRISHLFQGIYGTPRTKVEIVQSIINKYNLLPREVILVGDAETDRIAACEANVNFVARITHENLQLFKTEENKIVDFISFTNVITSIESYL